MKKIILIFAILLLSLSGYAQDIQVSDIEYKNYISSRLTQENNLKQQINNVLNDIELKNDEFIILSGKLSSNKELTNYNIKALNTSDDKADLIIKKLNESKLVYNYIPDIYNPITIYDEFNLYIGATPQYETNKGFIVLFGLTNDKLKQNDMPYKEKMDEHVYGLSCKFHPEFVKIKKEYGIPDDKVLTIILLIDRNGNLLDSNIINSIDQKTDNHMLSIIKKSSPFNKLPSQYNFSTYSAILSFNRTDAMSYKIKKNIKNTILISDYSIIVKTVQNKHGDIISASIVKSSGNDLIDEEILAIIKKTSFIEFVRPDKEQQERYLNIRSSVKNNKEWHFDVFSQEINEYKEQTPINWQPYLIQAERQSKKFWKSYKSNKSYKVVAIIVLNKNGELVSRGIIQSSGIEEADNAVLKSIDDGAPYPKFPQGFDRSVLTIELTFDYHIANPLYNQSGYYSDKPKSKYQELMQKSYQQQMSRPSVNNFNSNQDFLLRIKDKYENKNNK